MQLHCRFYNERFPKEGDVVMAYIKSVDNTLVNIHLPEYNFRLQADAKEYSNNAGITLGVVKPMLVTKVVEDRGLLILSKEVNLRAQGACLERYRKAKVVNLILRAMASAANFETNEELLNLYDNTAWHFDEKYGKFGACAYDFFKYSVGNLAVLKECNVSNELRNILFRTIKNKFEATQIYAKFECVCCDSEGTDVVKDALHAGLALSTEDIPININLISSSVFGISAYAPPHKKQKAFKLVSEAMDEIKKICLGLEGRFEIKTESKIVTTVEKCLLDDKEVTNKEFIDEVIQREKCSRNIMIYNLPPSTSKDVKQMKDRDKKKIKELLVETLGRESLATEVQFERFTIVEKREIPPLKLIFGSSSLAAKVLKNKNKVSDKRIFMVREKSLYQKSQIRDLYKTLDRRIENGEQNLVIRHINNIPMIVTNKTVQPRSDDNKTCSIVPDVEIGDRIKPIRKTQRLKVNKAVKKPQKTRVKDEEESSRFLQEKATKKVNQLILHDSDDYADYETGHQGRRTKLVKNMKSWL